MVRGQLRELRGRQASPHGRRRRSPDAPRLQEADALTPTRRRPEGDLGGWLVANGLEPDAGAGSIADVARVRALVVGAAREARALSYSEALMALGHRFTRPKMRALCRTLDAIDAAGAAAGEPGLAVLVVRESDRLPGQGWWIDTARPRGYAGAWTGEDAAAFVRARQDDAFRYWRDR